jgi:hypothetical protein
MFPIYGRNKNVPNHQPVLNGFSTSFEATNQFDEDALKNLDLFPHWNTLYNCNTS